jgi:hypothetical protein
MKVDGNSFNDSNQENVPSRNRQFDRSATDYVGSKYTRNNPFRKSNSTRKDDLNMNPFQKPKTVNFKTPIPVSRYIPLPGMPDRPPNPFASRTLQSGNGGEVKVDEYLMINDPYTFGKGKTNNFESAGTKRDNPFSKSKTMPLTTPVKREFSFDNPREEKKEY